MAPKLSVPKKRPAAASTTVRRGRRRRSLSDSNKKKQERRRVAQRLNTVALELGVSHLNIDRRNPNSGQVERLLRLVNARSPSATVLAEVRAATQKWTDNGGELSVELAEDSDDGGTPVDEDVPSLVEGHRLLKPTFRLRSKAFMLTYNNREFKPTDWSDFRKFLCKLKKAFGARAWAAALEQSLQADGTSAQEVFHMHGYLLWLDGVGVDQRDLGPFHYKGVRPRVDTCREKKTPAGTFSAACHGLWYVSFPKEGTKFNDTNFPAWKMYQPKVQWLEGLWRTRKITTDYFLQVSATEFRVGHAARKRDASEVLSWERERNVDADVNAELQCLRTDQPLAPLQTFPEIEDFVASFNEARWRRPVLAIVGATNTGKSLLAANVIERVGEVLGVKGMVEITVEQAAALDFSNFDRRMHAGVLLDGVGDVSILKCNREALQGRPKQLKGGQSATMMYAYPYSLCRRAVVATFDMSAKNLHLFTTDHWLSSSQNVVQLWLRGPAWEAGSSTGGSQTNTVGTHGVGVTWDVDAVASFLDGG